MVPSIKKNYLYNTLQTVLNILLPLFSFSYVARVFGPAIIGKVNFAFALVSFFTLVAGLSIPFYAAREIARVRDNALERNKVFSELLALTALSALIVSLFYFVLVYSVPRFNADLPLFLLAGINLFLNFTAVDWVYIGFENYQYNSLRSSIFKAITTLAVFPLIAAKGDYYIFAVLLIIGVSGSNLLGFAHVWNHVSWTRHKLNFLRHVKPVAYLFGSAVAVSVYMYLDSVFLGLLSGEQAVGHYSVATKIDRTLVMIVVSIGIVLVPRISYYLQNGKIDEYSRVAQKSIDFIYLISFPLTLAVVILAPQLVMILAGDEFGPAINAVKICALIIPVIGFTNFLGIQILFPNGEEKKMFYCTLIAMCVNLGLNALLIPRFHHIGASISLVCAEITVLISQLIVAEKRYMLFKLFNKWAVQSIVASLTMGGVLIFLCTRINSPIMCLMIATVTGSIVYFGILFCLKNYLLLDIAGQAGRYFAAKYSTNQSP